MDEDKFRIQRMRNMLQEMSELTVSVQKEISNLSDQVDESFLNVDKDGVDKVRESIILAVNHALDRPGVVVNMGLSRVVDATRFEAGGSRIFGPTTFTLKVVYDEARSIQSTSTRAEEGLKPHKGRKP